MGKIKVESIRVQLGCKKQKDFVDLINNKMCETHPNEIRLSLRTYHNRITGRTSWKLSEANAISEITGIPISEIDF